MSVNMNKYIKARIINCAQPDFWYANKIGDVILVRSVDWPSVYMEAKNGASVLKWDLQPIVKEKNERS